MLEQVCRVIRSCSSLSIGTSLLFQTLDSDVCEELQLQSSLLPHLVSQTVISLIRNGAPAPILLYTPNHYKQLAIFQHVSCSTYHNCTTTGLSILSILRLPFSKICFTTERALWIVCKPPWVGPYRFGNEGSELQHVSTKSNCNLVSCQRTLKSFKFCGQTYVLTFAQSTMNPPCFVCEPVEPDPVPL